MKTIWSPEVDKILQKGYSLEKIGVDNWALRKSDALSTLEHLASLNIPILGGDVYEIKEDSIQATYDNWYYEREANESITEFVIRSIKEARAYIEKYQSSTDKDVLFALVPDIQNILK